MWIGSPRAAKLYPLYRSVSYSYFLVHHPYLTRPICPNPLLSVVLRYDVKLAHHWFPPKVTQVYRKRCCRV